MCAYIVNFFLNNYIKNKCTCLNNGQRKILNIITCYYLLLSCYEMIIKISKRQNLRVVNII